jgi:hypothetical protein
MTDTSAVSFEADIRPMFTEMDVAHMKAYGIDLSDRSSVQASAVAIYDTVSGGSMPPPSSGEERWTDDMCERFKHWQEQGCPP